MSDDSARMRDDMWMVPGQVEAQRRLMTHEYKVFPAFESLDLMSVETAQEYLKEPLAFLTGRQSVNLLDGGRLFGVILGFALVCVEADRKARGE